jgi:hypothetical protein
MARVSEVSKECEWGRGEGGPVLHQLPELSGLGSVICGRAVLEADEGLPGRNCEARIGISVVIGNPHLSVKCIRLISRSEEDSQLWLTHSRCGHPRE